MFILSEALTVDTVKHLMDKVFGKLKQLLLVSLLSHHDSRVASSSRSGGNAGGAGNSVRCENIPCVSSEMC